MVRARRARAVASFDSTHEALEAERCCHEGGIEGRIIPMPVSLGADCGMAWSMPPECRPAFEAAARGRFAYARIVELEL
ncbi:DUF3343 domain-containing protein [Olsenella urininfantis]|uniref:DUF3343 domain-containing protein n=1 Tax=Olsenella urininfantis TaxID=1871033 RepID=UPI0009844D1B|nr:DUF3343 domain-containing protein [Olsenella urininfantis]